MKLLSITLALTCTLYTTTLISADDAKKPEEEPGTLFIMPYEFRYAGRHYKQYAPEVALAQIGAIYRKECSDDDKHMITDLVFAYIPLSTLFHKKDGDPVSLVLNGKNIPLRCGNNPLNNPRESFAQRLERYLKIFETSARHYGNDRKLLMSKKVLAKRGWWNPRISHGPKGFKMPTAQEQSNQKVKLLH